MFEFDKLPSETLIQIYPSLSVDVETGDGETCEEQQYYAVMSGSIGVM